jgi:predicted nucleic acid-binding protein
MERVALDTTFLIDVQSERRARGQPRGAIGFLRAHPTTELMLPSIALGEYLEGFDDPGGAEALALVSTLRILPVTDDVVRAYAAVARSLRAAGRLIGTNDLWIACTAKAAALPIVTRDTAHFQRVPGLEVVGYAH